MNYFWGQEGRQIIVKCSKSGVLADLLRQLLINWISLTYSDKLGNLEILL